MYHEDPVVTQVLVEEVYVISPVADTCPRAGVLDDIIRGAAARLQKDQDYRLVLDSVDIVNND